MPKENTVDTAVEETEVQESDIKDNDVDLEEDELGQKVTFDEIIKRKAYEKDYRKMVDKEVSKAIKSYKTNHQSDMEALISQKVAEQVNEVKFEACLKENLLKAGVIDTTALIAHLDLKELKESFDVEKKSIKGLDALITSSKEKMPYLFKQENQSVATGQAQNSFGGGKPSAHNLREALAEKYGK